MDNIIKEVLENFVNERRSKLRQLDHGRGLNLFNSTLSEVDNQELRNHVLELIKNNEWEEPQDAQSFYNSLKQSKHQMMLTDYTPSELSKMKLFKLKNYNIGYALKQTQTGNYDEGVAVHNNEPEIKGIGNELVRSAINNGMCYGDHFDGYLTPFYKNLGFVEIKREPYEPQYDPNSEFANKYGKADVIFMIHKNCLNK